MVAALQLDFFEPMDEVSALRKLVIIGNESHRKQAKKLFALNSKLQLEILLIRNDLEYLKMSLKPKAEIMPFVLTQDEKSKKRKAKNV